MLKCTPSSAKCMLSKGMNTCSSRGQRRGGIWGGGRSSIGKKLTFDRRVVELVETPLFYKNNRNRIVKIFLASDQFSLKCFLNWLIGQLVF